MSGKIFISYRRGDDPGHTGRLFDRLQEAFQPGQLFLDVDGIAPGLDFFTVLQEQVEQCDVMLVVIGTRWLDAVDHQQNRRLDEPNDFVRFEIESALKQKKRVIPVLVGEARMPRPEELPETIRPLARRNAVRLTHDRFRADIQSLITALRQVLDETETTRRAKAAEERKRETEAAEEGAEARRTAEEHAPQKEEGKPQAPEASTVSVTADEAHVGPLPPQRGWWRRSMKMGSAAIVLIAAAVIGYLYLAPEKSGTRHTTAVQDDGRAPVPKNEPDTDRIQLGPPPQADAVPQAPPASVVVEQQRAAAPLTPQREQALRPKDTFRECDVCPEMVVVPAGSFLMGSPPSERGRFAWEGPQHQVAIGVNFAVAKFEVTFAQWDACTLEGGCNKYRPSDEGWGREQRPVILVSWVDAKAYLDWLSKKAGRRYRLLSEAEWEYAARAGSSTTYPFGDEQAALCKHGNGPDASARKGRDWEVLPCNDRFPYTSPVGSFPANGFGLHDMIGNVWEWTEDCWNESYRNAPSDGSPWLDGNCDLRALRGGAWHQHARDLRPARRYRDPTSSRTIGIGLRVARTISSPQ